MDIKSHPLDEIESVSGQILVMKESTLRPQYRTLVNRFYRAMGGFGCHNVSRGRAIFTKEMFGTLEERWDRGDFEGWMTDKEFATFCEENNLDWEVLANGNVPAM